MRDQYAGDISDLLKFGLLRALAGADRVLGIVWYYVPGDDGRPDGRHLEWRQDQYWRRLDEPLFDGLSSLPERGIAALEGTGIWPPRTRFFREPVPSRSEREAWSARMVRTLEPADLVFLDPDNGLGGESSKHATFAEVRALRRPGRAIVFITFPGRNKPHEVLVRELHERLRSEVGASAVVTVRTSVAVPSLKKPGGFVPRQRWFTVLDAGTDLRARIGTFAGELGALPRAGVRLES